MHVKYQEDDLLLCFIVGTTAQPCDVSTLCIFKTIYMYAIALQHK